jgi:metallophosphoesterase (TIGR00282 family)
MPEQKTNMDRTLHILFISDIIGAAGREVVASVLPRLRNEYTIDLVIANGENATMGLGIDDKTLGSLHDDLGIDVISSGNHIWQRRKYLKKIDLTYVLRPINYPEECPGHGSCVFETERKTKVGIINLQGRSFMSPIDCPFKTALKTVESFRNQDIRCIFVDFHAEATAEKMALAWYLDGKVSAVIGTHTHVQTADEQILPDGTAYLTDAGMTGPHHSVIGMNIDTAVQRFITQIPYHYLQAPALDLKFCAAYISVDPETGRALSIERLKIDV